MLSDSEVAFSTFFLNSTVRFQRSSIISDNLSTVSISSSLNFEVNFLFHSFMYLILSGSRLFITLSE